MNECDIPCDHKNRTYPMPLNDDTSIFIECETPENGVSSPSMKSIYKYSHTYDYLCTEQLAVTRIYSLSIYHLI